LTSLTGSRLPRSWLRRRQYDDTTLAHREPGSRLPRSQRRRQFEDILSCIIINYTTIAYNCLFDLSRTHASTLTTLTVNCVRSCLYSDRLAYRQSANQRRPDVLAVSKETALEGCTQYSPLPPWHLLGPSN